MRCDARFKDEHAAVDRWISKGDVIFPALLAESITAEIHRKVTEPIRTERRETGQSLGLISRKPENSGFLVRTDAAIAWYHITVTHSS